MRGGARPLPRSRVRLRGRLDEQRGDRKQEAEIDLEPDVIINIQWLRGRLDLLVPYVALLTKPQAIAASELISSG